VKSVSEPSFKLGKYLIKLIYKEILAEYRIEIGANFIVKDQVFVGFDRRWIIHRGGLCI